jgi:glycosyltransferase involved in cell wall biosynthesis
VSPLVSVILLVKDGARYLEEVLDAVASQRLDGDVETLVVDSGSSDGSVEIARTAAARVIEIPPAEFRHGTTRNFAAEQATGDYLVFLTQDATPSHEHWLADLIAPLDVERRVGFSFGPHRPRPGTSPMVARELEEFFGSFSPNGSVRVDCNVRPGEPASGFFSNVNSCISRSCWESVRFRDIAYAEDQAFARDAFVAGWCKAFVPQAAVLHAHDYPFRTFMRRYFDEYRGLREAAGHVEPARAVPALRRTRSEVRKDAAYMKGLGWGAGKRALWRMRSARHHLGRALFSALGSRAERLPGWLRRRLSLEPRSGDAAAGERPAGARAGRRPNYDYVRDYLRRPPVPLDPVLPADADAGSFHLAWVVPPFRRGSGGHMTIFNIAKELEARGHSCSIWVTESGDGTFVKSARVLEKEIRRDFARIEGPVYRGLDDWHGADVAFATGWQTAYPMTGLHRCKLKAYLVQDYEPDFYPASAQRLWSEQTYRMGYPCIAASPWLRDVLRERFGLEAEAFELGVDHQTYRLLGTEREESSVAFYARKSTPRRATELGVLALAELKERRPEVRVILFGDQKQPEWPADFEFPGVLDEQSLSSLYNRATVGLVLSLTNYSRIPKEMMACGLPVVDVLHPSTESIFGPGGELIEMAEPDPLRIADRLAELLDDSERRTRLASAARSFVEPMTWEAAALQVDEHVRRWLKDAQQASRASDGRAPSSAPAPAPRSQAG